ncbi:hypothetical protein DH2020_032135 [Rehmannia glutinosa]|uniref:Uncharacterized protein n=1 Tax=Rehmannia glutinosa TaxID=99300 RepID=A0ABR0VG17_REHGL
MLNSRFDMKDMDLAHVILGIKISRTSNRLTLDQSHYVDKILEKFSNDDTSLARTPIDTSKHLLKNRGEAVSQVEYSRVIESLMYLMSCTRPEIAFVVNKVCQFMQKPLNSHWKKKKRILGYLNGTVNYGLHFTPTHLYNLTWLVTRMRTGHLIVMMRRSTTGIACFWVQILSLGNQRNKRYTVSRSSTEAEYRSVASLVAEITWIRGLLQEIHVHSSKPPIIWCDNSSTVRLTSNPVLHARTKHIELDLYFVREKVQQKN